MGIDLLRLAILFVVLLIGSLSVLARPISYSGGSTVMVRSDEQRDNIYFHYSPTFKYSLGIEGGKHKYLNDDYVNLRFTYLLNRRNTVGSQRNVYFTSGVSLESEADFYYGIQGDWETRRWFSGIGFQQTTSDTQDYSSQYLQFGIAPYLGNYGDLHTWLMLKSTRNSIDDEWNTTPIIKIFQGSALLELGYSKSSQWDVHFIYRF